MNDIRMQNCVCNRMYGCEENARFGVQSLVNLFTKIVKCTEHDRHTKSSRFDWLCNMMDLHARSHTNTRTRPCQTCFKRAWLRRRHTRQRLCKTSSFGNRFTECKSTQKKKIKRSHYYAILNCVRSSVSLGEREMSLEEQPMPNHYGSVFTIEYLARSPTSGNRCEFDLLPILPWSAAHHQQKWTGGRFDLQFVWA